MSVKAIFLNFTRILLFSGALFFSLTIQAQESETETKEATQDKKEKQTPDSKENPSDKKTLDGITHKLIADKNKNVQETKDKNKETSPDKKTLDGITHKLIADKNRNIQEAKDKNKNEEKPPQEAKGTQSTDKKTKTSGTNKVTKDKKTENTSATDNAQTSEVKDKNGLKTKIDEADKTKPETSPEKKQTPNQEEKASIKKEEKASIKKVENNPKTDNEKAKNTENKNKEKTPTNKKPDEAKAKEVKNKTGETKTKTETSEKNQTKTVQETQENNEAKKEIDPEKQKTTLEHEAQKVEGNVIKAEKQEPKKQEAQTQKEKQDKKEDTVVVGHRVAQTRSLLDSPVPVDVIDNSKLITFGNTVDITDQLNTLVPSYMASPATVKNSAFVRPTSLRGMAGDQTLVLINGKRRHRSSLVQEFGPLTNRGSQGIDIAMIPTIALKNVEVLRGGASAQYGSDAMAGVLNFNLKEAPDKATVQATYGQFFEGERSWRVGGSLGLSLLDNRGFANLSFDTNEAQGHSRGEQDRRVPRMLASIGHKNKIGIGNDAIFDDSPLVNSWGRPEKTSTRFMINSGLQINSDMKAYLFGNYAVANDRIRLLYRDPKDPAFMGSSHWADNLNEIKKTGFTPFLNGEQEDYSATVGIKGFILGNTTYDFSMGFGSNTLYQKLKNSLNPDSQTLYGAAQRDFNLGSYKHQEQNLNADFSTTINEKTNTSVSYGLEYRKELFGQYAGSLGSYVGRGPSGMMGVSLLEAGEYKRNNYSAYIDFEHTFRKSMFIQYSLRYDHFSDFGQTINNKIASLIKLTPNLSLRGSFSTNFRAPTLGQSNLKSTIVNELLPQTHHYNIQSKTINIPASSSDVRTFGGSSLEEEKSTNVSLGLISKVGENNQISLDGYSVTVKDRIYKNIVKHNNTYENNISFFANALDLKHQGADLVWTTDLSKHVSFADILVNLAYNYNTIDITDNKFIGGHKVLTAEQVEDMENNYPKHNFILMANIQIQKFGFMTRARYIGDHYGEMGTLERKRKKHERQEGYNDSKLSQQIDPIVYLDLELSYKPTKDLTFALGGANIFDKYPQRVTRPYANLMNYGMPYARQTVANYEGGSWYLRMLYNF